MPLVVQKFGGTSVGSVEKIKDVAKLVAQSSHAQKNVVVVSAMSGETNRLVKAALEISAQPFLPAYDMLLASGEQVSCALLAIALHELGIKAQPLLGFQAGIQTDSLFSNARIKNIQSSVLEAILANDTIPIIAGFQGVSDSDDELIPLITTLGRGGSDTSAVAVAAALKADRCDIFTDVDGVYTCDPRIVPQARRIKQMSFDEMMELASLGAKVLHMRSVELAAKFNIPLRVLSTFKPHDGATLVTNLGNMESPVVTALSAESGETLMSFQLPDKEGQKPSVFFKPLAAAGINVDVINKTSADHSGQCTLSFTVPTGEVKRVAEILKTHNVMIHRTPLAKVSIVGIGMRTHAGVAARMFEALENRQIPIHLVTTSEIKVSCLIPESEKNLALQCLHEEFELALERAAEYRTK